MPKTGTYGQFRCLRHKLAWIAVTRPDVMATSNIYSQVTSETFDPDNIKQMKKSLKYLQSTAEQKLIYNSMNMGKFKLVVFANGSHGSNNDYSSRLGYLVFLTDSDE